MMMMMVVKVTVIIRIVGSQVDDDLVRSVYALERLRAQQYRGGHSIRLLDHLYFFEIQTISEHPDFS